MIRLALVQAEIGAPLHVGGIVPDAIVAVLRTTSSQFANTVPSRTLLPVSAQSSFGALSQSASAGWASAA